MNVWDVHDPIRELIRSRRVVARDLLTDPAIPLTEVLEPKSRSRERLVEPLPEALGLWASEGGAL